MKLFAVSDIHSYYDAMMTALNEKGFDANNPDHHLVVCGDLFDRGPDAIKCFDFCKTLSAQNRLIYVRGNHEDLLLDCIEDIRLHMGIGHHHITNGTMGTIDQFTGMDAYDLMHGWFDEERFNEAIAPLVDFIKDNCVDFAEISNYVFTHGWVPVDDYYHVVGNWPSDDADWYSARWLNGMNAWHKGARLPDKTIVCGHWHCSWGHSHLHQDRKEFPQKNRVNWQESFVPFVDEGIIAIDACTAYTGFCNCIVIDV